VFLPLLGVFAWVVAQVPEGGARIGAAAVIAAMAVVALVMLARGALAALRARRHGRAELRFVEFPFFLGGRVDAVLVRQAGAPALDAVEATLRCVQDRWVGRGRSRHVEGEILHEETRTVAVHGPERLHLPLRFDLPADPALGTALAADAARYWELELRSALRGLDFRARFLVPVYVRTPGP
jgi:hypothetical protein